MKIPNDRLRIFLTFPNELKLVKVLAATNRPYNQLRFMGVVEEKERLEDLLDEAGVDHYIICSGEPLTNNFRATAFENSPKQIADDLEEIFKTANELQLKILRGKVLTDAELSFTVPKRVHLCSSSVTADEGLARIQTWFNAGKVSPSESLRPGATTSFPGIY